MECQLYLGAMCILLEDLGFKRRLEEKHFPMTYYYHELVMSKVYADLDRYNVIEIILSEYNISVDKWSLRDKLYYVIDEAEFEVHNPNSIPGLAEYIQTSIRLL